MPLAESAFGAVARIGFYFSVVSVLPAAVLTAAAHLLLATQAWTGTPDWSAAGHALTDITASGLLAGVLVTIFIALLLHPLQFAMIQLLEGYWGPGRLAVRLASARIRQHRAAVKKLGEQAGNAKEKLEERGHLDSRSPVPAGDVDLLWVLQEADRLRMNYPLEYNHFMPTRLGNVLRRYEVLAGNPYGLNALTVTPHLTLVGTKEHVERLNDQRTQLDLTTRLCVTAGLYAVLATAVLAAAGWWLLLVSVPYLLAVVLYRGACIVAHDYGTALTVLMDLNRSQLYERMGLKRHSTLAAERARNANLEKVLGERSILPKHSLNYAPQSSVGRVET
jgi:hypothetical protein